MLFPPSSQPMAAHLHTPSHASLDALQGLTAYEMLEITCRNLVGILRASSRELKEAPQGHAKFNDICDGVEQWLTTEIDALRFEQG